MYTPVQFAQRYVPRRLNKDNYCKINSMSQRNMLGITQSSRDLEFFYLLNLHSIHTDNTVRFAVEYRFFPFSLANLFIVQWSYNATLWILIGWKVFHGLRELMSDYKLEYTYMKLRSECLARSFCLEQLLGCTRRMSKENTRRNAAKLYIWRTKASASSVRRTCPTNRQNNIYRGGIEK